MTPEESFWPLYEGHSAFVLGFHGCDEEIGEGLLRGHPAHLRKSENDYDWLGHGIYFWENDPERALEFAEQRADGGKNSQGRIKTPFVVGAIIDLKRCLNLMDRSALKQVKKVYNYFEKISQQANFSMLTNGNDLRQRRLDCAVIETLHTLRTETDVNGLQFDSVRGLFFEGPELYPNAGFREKNHIQICVRNQACIKGYFRPISG